MKTQIFQGNPFHGFESFGDGPNEDQKKRNPKIWFRVLVSQLPPRDEQFLFHLEMGRSHIQAVLEHRKLGSNNLFFCFPERWMCAKEEMMFIPLLEKHPEILKSQLTIVSMITKSPLIAGNLRKDDLRSLRNPKLELGGLTKATQKLVEKFKLEG